MTVSSGIAASAFTTAGYLLLKSLLLRERRYTLPPDLIARARYPSSFSSTDHPGPSDRVSLRNSSMGSMKVAFVFRSHRSGSRDPILLAESETLP